MSNIEIIHGDCLDTLVHYGDNFFDMALTSPPYDELRSYNGFSFNPHRLAKESAQYETKSAKSEQRYAVAAHPA